MATISGIKINESFDQHCGIFSADETISSIKQHVVKSGIDIINIADSAYNMYGRACVTATVISNVNKFIQVLAGSSCIVMYTTNGSTWTEGRYESSGGESRDIQGPFSTNVNGVIWYRSGHVIQVSSNIIDENTIPSGGWTVTGLPTPAPVDQLSIIGRSYNTSVNDYIELRYDGQQAKFTLAVMHTSSSSGGGQFVFSGTYIAESLIN